MSSNRIVVALALLLGIPAVASPVFASEATSYRSLLPEALNERAPEDEARPGEKFFQRAAEAYRKDDYAFAVDMYRVSASWGFKPAQYNLGLMYSQGDGIKADRALGLAWLALAAERGDKDYSLARDLAYRDMSSEEFARANELWRDLSKDYGDRHALKRARNHWRQVRSAATGSHLGNGAGHGVVGGAGFGQKSGRYYREAWEITAGRQVDNSIAYRQLLDSDNPYDTKFILNAPRVTVESIIPIGDGVERKNDTPRRFL